MSDVPRMNHIKRTMAHDHLLPTRPRTDNRAKLLHRLDLVANLSFACLIHFYRPSEDSMTNHVFAALAMVSGSHKGAFRQYSILSRMRCTPSSKFICCVQPSWVFILVMSAHVQSGSPGRLGMCTTDPPSNSTSRLTVWGMPAP